MRYIIDKDNLPDRYPTHMLPSRFWEELGRSVAAFGFLEEVLGKAIFALTATKELKPEEVEKELEKFLPTLERALSDALGGLITSFQNAVIKNGGATIENLDELIADLRKAADFRNVLCHDLGELLTTTVDRYHHTLIAKLKNLKYQ